MTEDIQNDVRFDDYEGVNEVHDLVDPSMWKESRDQKQCIMSKLFFHIRKMISWVSGYAALTVRLSGLPR